MRWYTKVHYFTKDRLREEIDYIGRRIKASAAQRWGTLRIADSNYGMFERDIEISGYIGEAQKEYGWPDLHRRHHRQEPAGARHRVAREGERRAGALPGGAVARRGRRCKNIKRENISKEAYEQIMIHMRGRGLRSLSDLILGLPGETLESAPRGHRRSCSTPAPTRCTTSRR